MDDLDVEIQRLRAEWRAVVERRAGTHVAIEALWDGDADGWFLEVALVSHDFGDFVTHTLGVVRYGGDFRLFQGTVPPWPESTIARTAGADVARACGLEFYFPSPEEPDDDCPHVWERGDATACVSCNKPLVRDRGPYVRPDVCYPCQRDGERRRALIADAPGAPDSGGVCFMVVENGRPVECLYVNLAATRALAARLAEILGDREPPSQLSPHIELTLTPDEVQILQRDAEFRSFSEQCRGRAVEVVGNGGITGRDVSFLCLAAARRGTITVAELAAAFPFLSADAIESTLAKLERRAFLTRQAAGISLTARGLAVRVAGPSS